MVAGLVPANVVTRSASRPIRRTLAGVRLAMPSSYRECADALSRVGAGLSPAEWHGVVCGLACARRGLSVRAALEEALGEASLAASLDSPHALLADEAQALLTALRSPGFEFDPLLPGDEATLGERSGALAQWCGGYLSGLGLGGLTAHASLSDEAREVLSDLGEFSRLRPEDADSAAAEADYFELVEYLRVGVMLVHEELIHGRDTAAQGGDNPLLH